MLFQLLLQFELLSYLDVRIIGQMIFYFIFSILIAWTSCYSGFFRNFRRIKRQEQCDGYYVYYIVRNVIMLYVNTAKDIFVGICDSQPLALALCPGPRLQSVFDCSDPNLYFTAPVPICIYWLWSLTCIYLP